MKKNLITIAGFIAVLNAFYYFQLEGAALVEKLNSVTKNLAFCSSIKDFEENYNLSSADAKAFKEPFLGELELENLSYSYPNSDNFALKEVSLSIKAGESLAIVGANASGKTILLNLIAGLLEPSKGRVFVNKENPRLISDSSLYNTLGIVPQEIRRYQG